MISYPINCLHPSQHEFSIYLDCCLLEKRGNIFFDSSLMPHTERSHPPRLLELPSPGFPGNETIIREVNLSAYIVYILWDRVDVVLAYKTVSKAPSLVFFELFICSSVSSSSDGL